LKEKYALILKRAQKNTMDRDSDRAIDLRYNIVPEWKKIGVEFIYNCVFIDEAGFDTHTIRNRAQPKVDEPAVVKVPTQKGVNVSVIICIPPYGTVNFSEIGLISEEDAKILEQEYSTQHSTKKRKFDTENK
ncbi:hypothetical protein BJ944DRAFT_156784, partial [Cunninghamella echinulata]